MGARRREVKSRREASVYKQGVRSKRGYQNTNTMEPFRGLQGSNEDFYSYDMPPTNNDAVGVKRLKVKKFIKEHIFEEIIAIVVTIAIGIASWTLTNVIQLKEQVAVFTYRIEQAETQLEEINNDFVTKEYLLQELQILKLQLEKVNGENISEIETQIKLIEKQIEYLSKNQSTNEPANEPANEKDGNT